ncbi:phosphotransferase family protein [Pseudonocardia sp. K10HN5]|uniref:Phosphotransferase family protein n=1 Tax=Pseudonocardia acidicola TaxID=2724939 RepID=A0ABX1S9I1_9PSEU|nr:phosphotransferase family protein [Pseudonocardia acidicola]
MGEVSGALEAFLRRNLPPHAKPQVWGLRRSGTGSSRENWPFDAAWVTNGTRSVHQLLMRRDPPAGVVDTQRATEFGLLRRLVDTPVPSPVVHWLDDSGEHLLRPTMIVERYEGAAHRAVLRSADPLRLGADRQRALAERLCEVLATLHLVDVDATGIRGDLEDPGPDPADHELTRWERELDAQELEPQPALRAAAAWLRDHLPPRPARTVVVHGDFRPANVLVHSGELALLLDWELAHLGDPLDDLGWYTTPLYAREHFIPGSWEVEDFLRRYTERTGIEVDRDALVFWQVMSAFRLAVIALTGVRNYCTGATDRPAAPADGVIRQVLAGILATGGR